MNSHPDEGVRVEELLGLARCGDATARQALIRWVCGRLGRQSSDRLRRGFSPLAFIGVETGDVSQDLYLRLDQYFGDDPSKVPASPGAMISMAKKILENQLVDLKRKHFGQGDRKRARRGLDSVEEGHPLLRETSHLGRWRDDSQVRELIERLPEKHREVVRLAHQFADDPPTKIEAIRLLLGLTDPGSAYRCLRQALEAFAKLVEQDERKSEGAGPDGR